MTTDSSENKMSVWKQVGFGVYIGCFAKPLTRLFLNVVPFYFALPLAMILILTTSYFFFFRGTAIWWEKDKKLWTFRSFMASIPIAAAALSLILYLLREWIEY